MSPVRRRKSLRALVKRYKQRPCADCGLCLDYPQMSYDHVWGTKKFNLGGSLRGKTKEEVLAEIAKCEVVCLDCHSVREAKRSASVA